MYVYVYDYTLSMKIAWFQKLFKRKNECLTRILFLKTITIGLSILVRFLKSNNSEVRFIQCNELFFRNN